MLTLKTSLFLAFLFGLLYSIFAVEPSTTVTPVQSVPYLDMILKENEKYLAQDFIAYRNHCYRVYNIALGLFPKPPPKQVQEIFAIAVAFHDLGIWTDDTIDYLPPSSKLAENWLKKHSRTSDLELVYLLIDNHHKITAYTGKHEELVEIFRKADWIDFTLTIRNFGVERSDIYAYTAPFPNKGFHLALFKMLIKSTFRLQQPFPMFKF